MKGENEGFTYRYVSLLALFSIQSMLTQSAKILKKLFHDNRKYFFEASRLFYRRDCLSQGDRNAATMSR
jgi:hypothetical protein